MAEQNTPKLPTINGFLEEYRISTTQSDLNYYEFLKSENQIDYFSNFLTQQLKKKYSFEGVEYTKQDAIAWIKKQLRIINWNFLLETGNLQQEFILLTLNQSWFKKYFSVVTLPENFIIIRIINYLDSKLLCQHYNLTQCFNIESYVSCNKCEGTGKITTDGVTENCTQCNGTGELYNNKSITNLFEQIFLKLAKEQNEYFEYFSCENCEGTGKITNDDIIENCTQCNGTGIKNIENKIQDDCYFDDFIEYQIINCTQCNGTGKIKDTNTTCTQCDGTGKTTKTGFQYAIRFSNDQNYFHKNTITQQSYIELEQKQWWLKKDFNHDLCLIDISDANIYNFFAGRYEYNKINNYYHNIDSENPYIYIWEKDKIYYLSNIKEQFDISKIETYCKETCENCKGTGKITNNDIIEDCTQCNGTGKKTIYITDELSDQNKFYQYGTTDFTLNKNQIDLQIKNLSWKTTKNTNQAISYNEIFNTLSFNFSTFDRKYVEQYILTTYKYNYDEFNVETKQTIYSVEKYFTNSIRNCGFDSNSLLKHQKNLNKKFIFNQKFKAKDIFKNYKIDSEWLTPISDENQNITINDLWNINLTVNENIANIIQNINVMLDLNKIQIIVDYLTKNIEQYNQIVNEFINIYNILFTYQSFNVNSYKYQKFVEDLKTIFEETAFDTTITKYQQPKVYDYNVYFETENGRFKRHNYIKNYKQWSNYLLITDYNRKFPNKLEYELQKCSEQGEKQGVGIYNEECWHCKNNNKIDCPNCNGIGEIDRGSLCSVCNGLKQLTTILCDVCNGSGNIKNDSKPEQTEKCSNCNETGRIICPTCFGFGRLIKYCKEHDNNNTNNLIINSLDVQTKQKLLSCKTQLFGGYNTYIYYYEDNKNSQFVLRNDDQGYYLQLAMQKCNDTYRSSDLNNGNVYYWNSADLVCEDDLISVNDDYYYIESTLKDTNYITCGLAYKKIWGTGNLLRVKVYLKDIIAILDNDAFAARRVYINKNDLTKNYNPTYSNYALPNNQGQALIINAN